MAQLYLKGVYYDTESEGLWYLDNSGTYQEISGGGTSYLVYKALLSQSGGGAPTVAAELINTIGAIVWTRDGGGAYLATLADAFPVFKTWAIPSSQNRLYTMNMYQNSVNDVALNTSITATGVLTDGLLDYTLVSIEVYP